MRMPTIKTVMVVLLGSHMLLVHSAPQLSHRYRGGSFMSNNLTLSCNDDLLRNTFSDFWLNSTTMPLTAILSPYALRSNVGEIDFTITPNLEGSYYCGNISQDLTSNPPLELTAYPERHPVQTYYAVEAGQPVTMQCDISPGKLIQRYTCIWRKAASLPIRVSDTNYLISYENFSLTVVRTTLSDAGTDWRCRVIVDNPQTSHIDDWHLESNSIELVVYEKPNMHVPLLPSWKVIKGRNMTLSCAASGGPGLTFTWYHNGVNITELGSTGNGKYKIIGTTGDRTANSTLIVNQLRSTDSGTIACVAMVTVYMENPQLPNVTPVTFPNSSCTSLSVVEQPSTTTTQQPVTTPHTTHPITDATTPTPEINLTLIVVVVVVSVFILAIIAIIAIIAIVVIMAISSTNKRVTDGDLDEDEGRVQKDEGEEGEEDATCSSKTNPNTTKPVKVDGEKEECNLQENSSDEHEPWPKIWFESCL